MPYHKKVEFARLCGVSGAQISVNISRGKIMVSSTGLIDDSEPINAAFLERYKVLAVKRAATGKAVEEEPLPTREKQPTIPVVKVGREPKAIREKVVDEEMNRKIREKMAEESNLKKHKADLTAAEARMMRLKEDRINGQLIPSALIKPIFATHFQSLITTFRQSIDAMISDISQKTKLNANQQAEIRKRMVEELNLAVDRGISQTENSVDGIMNEYIRSKWKAA